MRAKTINRKNQESAISETISVILIVAITVIMSTFVVSYVFGSMPSLMSSRIVALTASQQGSDPIIIRYYGGPDHNSLVSLNIIWPSGVQQLVTSPKVGDVYTAGNFGPNPGPGINYTSGNDRIIIAGNFGVNGEQIVLDAVV